MLEPRKTDLHRSVNGSVDPKARVGCPGDPEGHYEDERHDVTGIAQVLRKGSGVLLVVDWLAGSQSSHHREDVEVSVNDSDDRRTEYEYREGDGVGGHISPVEHADERLAIEDRLVEAEQRRTAHHCHADPREYHPTLTSRFRLHHLVTQWFSVQTIQSSHLCYIVSWSNIRLRSAQLESTDV